LPEKNFVNFEKSEIKKPLQLLFKTGWLFIWGGYLMKMIKFFALVLVSVSIFSTTVYAGSGIHSIEEEIIKISESAKKSVAAIKVTKRAKGNYRDPFFDFLRQFGLKGRMQPYNPKTEGMGTGFVINEKEGLIVTNNHVIDGAEKIEIKINGKEFEGKLIGTDPQTDVGLVKIKKFKKGDIRELKFANSEKIKVGSFAIAIGNPFGLSHTVTFGIVSAKGRAGMNVTEYEDFIQTDAAINPGNSGGPLLNIKGEVIGMNTAIFSKSGGYMGIGFAVPANMVRSITSELKNGKKIQRAMMGVTIQELNDDLRKYLKIKSSLKGVLISSVAKNSPADKAGIKSGDVVTKFNGKTVDSVSKLKNAVGFSKFNKKLPVNIIRNGKKKTLKLVLKKDFDFAGVYQEADGIVSGELGITLAMKDGKVVIKDVAKDSLALAAGVLKGDIIVAVNKKKVKSVSQVVKFVKNTKSVLFLINRGGREFFVVVNR